MDQANQNPSTPAERGRALLTATFDVESRAPGTVFPLDGCDIATVSNETLIQLCETAPKLHKLGSTLVVRLSQTLIMKCGYGILPSEAQNMDFIAQLGGVRVPKVHRSFSNLTTIQGITDMTGYIVMDYVDGLSLADLWPRMNMRERQDVIDQLAAMIRKMQSVPLDFVGPVGGGVSHGIFFTDWGAGPFEDGSKMEDWFNHKLQVCKGFKKVPADAAPFEFPIFVFVHADIAPRNIIMDNNGLLWLIDWQMAGSYPPQLEAAVISRNHEFGDFRNMLLEHIEYDEEKTRQLFSIGWGLMTGAFL